MNKFEVNKNIIDKTNCEYDFACLKKDGKKLLCEVEKCLDEICFVKSEDNKFCDKMIYYGDSVICNCPVRIEIYNKYGA